MHNALSAATQVRRARVPVTTAASAKATVEPKGSVREKGQEEKEKEGIDAIMAARGKCVCHFNVVTLQPSL